MKERRPPFRIIATNHGFSMIEAIVVLIIIAILAPIVVSQAFKQADTTPLITEAEILKANLRYAQIRAMNDTVTWKINFASSTAYTLIRTGGVTPNLPGDPSNSTTHTLTGGVTIASGAGTTVIFNQWGAPVDGSGTPLTANTTVTLSQGGSSSSITITKNTGYIP